MADNKLTHLVFDLGGVIVELRGLPILNQWTGGDASYEEVWEKWLTSEAPRLFEAGKIGRDAFASQIVSELSLNVNEQTFLDWFSALPIGPFAGAIDVLKVLQQNYTTAFFSNSNEIHWELKMGEMQLGAVFDYHFASHLIGYVKPDTAAFEHVITALETEPAHILFYDDNQLNVEAALSLGMQAECVRGFDELQANLATRGIVV